MDLDDISVFELTFEEDPQVNRGSKYLSTAPVHVIPEEAYSSRSGADKGTHGECRELLDYREF